MGANQSDGGGLSNDTERSHRTNNQTNTEYHHSAGNYNQRQKRSKSKPSPPFRLRFLDITHNSITLSWQAQQPADGHSIIAYTVEIAAVSPGRDRQWKTLTKSCQGTSYDARNLDPNTGYMFRVRSENIYGVGKPSLPSEVFITKIYETLPADTRPSCARQSFHKHSDESAQSMKRHYGFSVHIGGGVKSILNHSDITIESSTSSHSPSVSDKAQKSHTLLRNNHRSSLPSNRKISAPILLPGTANTSLHRLRESRRSLRTETVDANLKSSARDSGISGLRESLTVFDSSSLDINFPPNSGDDCKKKNQDHKSLPPIHSNEAFTNSIDGDSGKGSKNSLCDISKTSDNQSCSISTDSDLVADINDEKTNNIKNVGSDNGNISEQIIDNADDIYKLKEELISLDLSDGKLKICEPEDKGNKFNVSTFSTKEPQKGYYDSLDNPWERSVSINEVSEQILAAPLSDDVKMALYNRNHPEDQRFITNCGHSLVGPKEATDFRTLRNVLQSNNMIVKTCRSLPDVVAVVMTNGEARAVTKGKLTTIIDADENDDAVRITTL